MSYLWIHNVWRLIIVTTFFLILHFFFKAHGDNPGKTTRVAVAVVDTFVWQALASVIIPGFTINRVCAASLYVLGRTTKWPMPVRKWTTTAIGLSTIPFIIKPIDRLPQVVLFACAWLCKLLLCKFGFLLCWAGLIARININVYIMWKEHFCVFLGFNVKTQNTLSLE